MPPSAWMGCAVLNAIGPGAEPKRFAEREWPSFLMGTFCNENLGDLPWKNHWENGDLPMENHHDLAMGKK